MDEITQQQINNLIGEVLGWLYLLLQNFNPKPIYFAYTKTQTINSSFQGIFADLDRVPNIDKSIKEFTIDPVGFNSWRKGVERILQIYSDDAEKGTTKYFAILHTIRVKIPGYADKVLDSYNVPLNWDAISRCLTLHFADKCDISTLEYQMTTLVQGSHQSVENFYQVM